MGWMHRIAASLARGGFVFFELVAIPAIGDDAVGVARVETGTNAVTAVEMPFEPLGEGHPADFISGDFAGDGGADSDMIHRLAVSNGGVTNAVYCNGEWLDPVTYSNTTMTAALGDALFFSRADHDSLALYLFGRKPLADAPSGFPRFSWLSVSPDGAHADLSILSGGRAFDLISQSNPGGGWAHRLRISGASEQVLFRDHLPSVFAERAYLVSDATRDTDGDGIPDALESRIFGTSPALADTDGDGLADGLEVAWGFDPLVADQPQPFSFFESFELPSVHPGDIAGQNGWTASAAGVAVVQSSEAFDGASALRLSSDSAGNIAAASCVIASSNEIVWVDCMVRAGIMGEDIDGVQDAVAAFGFDDGGHPVMTDGASVAINTSFAVDSTRWTRCTARLDYSRRVWDFYLDGVLAASDLAMRGGAERLGEISAMGDGGVIDAVSVSSARPAGLSSDGDAMADEWELARFGTLARDGAGDFDGDGLVDAAEFAAGTDPAKPDTDGDGMPDAWEASRGLNPTDATDSALDPDGDGMTNAEEYGKGGDPHFCEPDPTLRRAGLRVEFWRTAGKHTAMPDFASLMPSSLSISPQIDHPAVPWLADGTTPGDYFACRMTGFIRVPSDGDYIFWAKSDDGVELRIDGAPVLSDVAPHSARYVSATATLSAGWHPIEVSYYEDTGAEVLTLEWRGPGVVREVVPASAFCHLPVGDAPHGFVPGIDVDFYAFSRSLSNVSDFSGLAPVVSCVWGRISQASTSSAFDGAPPSLVDKFATDCNGWLRVPMSGVYTLSLASDDGSRLWIDDTLAIDNDGAHSAKTKTATLRLAAGMHRLRLGYFENGGAATLELSWKLAGFQSETIPARFFFRESGEPLDSDGDGMPDWWEAEHGLDAADPSDAAFDLDGDGLSNLAEFQSWTDPRRADTDGDGMPDAWEVAHGLCPFDAEAAFDDPDGDGLANIEEFRHGTNPNLADTDGDGCPDGLEVFNIRSNPLVGDIWFASSDLGSATPAATAVATTGTWRTGEDGSLNAAERAGSLTWNLAVPEGGADALAVRIGQHNFYSRATTFDLALYVDGLFVARQIVSAPYGTTSDAFFFLPEIPAGVHEFRLVWHNWEVNTFLSVYDLRFVTFGGPDADNDGVADWKNHRATESSSLGALPLESLVSPLCVEGRDLWRDVLEVEVAYPDTNAVFAAVKTIGDGFYADIPLPTNGTATVSLRDRALAESFPVVWSALDVFAGEYTEAPLAIRTGDSLKIGAFGDSSTEVSVFRVDASGEWEAVTNWTATAATPYTFDEPGLHLITASASSGLFSTTNAYALVDVVSSRFPKRNPAILMDAEQTLSCPSLSPRNLLEHDAELSVAAKPENGGVELTMLTHADLDLGLVSRLDEGGAISDAVQVSPVWADNGSYYRVAETYPDGSQLVEISLLLGSIPEGTTVNLEIFVSGVTFDDGTRTKTLAADDFDADGHITLRFIKARGVTTSVCHRTYIYQDGKLIYTNK